MRNEYSHRDIRVLKFRFVATLISVAVMIVTLVPLYMQMYSLDLMELVQMQEVADPEQTMALLLPFFAALGIAGFAGLAAGVFYLMFLYKCWSLIPQGWARTTPGKAVGFLFIPFFNLYWMFVAQVGLSVDVNRVLDVCKKEHLKTTTGVAIGMCVLYLLASFIGMQPKWALLINAGLMAVCYTLFFIFAFQAYRASKAVTEYFVSQFDEPLSRETAFGQGNAGV